MGESKLKQKLQDETLMTCTGVQTVAGRVQVECRSSAGRVQVECRYAGRVKVHPRRWGNWLTLSNLST